jgi:hypothetical protein
LERRAKIAVARPAAPAPTMTMSAVEGRLFRTSPRLHFDEQVEIADRG